MYRRRCRCLMSEKHTCVTAVVFNIEWIRILLEDDAACCLRCTSAEVCDAALANIGCSRSRAGRCSCTNILDILIVARIAALILPQSTVLQIETRRAAIVNESVESGIRRREGDIQLTCGQCEDVAVEADIPRARCRAVCARIHIDRALISSERIVAVFHASGNLD